MKKVVEFTKSLQKTMFSTTYSFEIDIEDFVSGFKNTIRKETKCLSKAIELKVKLTNDCGRYLSSTVQIVAVRFYKNLVLEKEVTIKEVSVKI